MNGDYLIFKAFFFFYKIELLLDCSYKIPCFFFNPDVQVCGHSSLNKNKNIYIMVTSKCNLP